MMTSDTITFTGVELSSGRKPVTFAVLDLDMNIKILDTGDSAKALSSLQEYENSSLAIDLPSSKSGQKIYMDLTKKFLQIGFKSISQRRQSKPWFETNAQDCFRILSGHRLFPRRSLEGRLQRCAILYEQGVRITDPVDMFEEITRYKLVQGILPMENLPSSNELDALVTAYLAWLAANRPQQTVMQGEFVLPATE
jgi:hypothetical protein